MVVEYASQGNLREYLRCRRPVDLEYWSGPTQAPLDSVEVRELVSAAYQVARGMAYLALQKVREETNVIVCLFVCMSLSCSSFHLSVFHSLRLNLLLSLSLPLPLLDISVNQSTNKLINPVFFCSVSTET